MIEETVACSSYFYVVLSQASVSGTGREKCVSLWSVMWPWGSARFGGRAGRGCKTGCNGTARGLPGACFVRSDHTFRSKPRSRLGIRKSSPRIVLSGVLCLYLVWIPGTIREIRLMHLMVMQEHWQCFVASCHSFQPDLH